MSPQMMKRVGLWESQSTTSTPTTTTISTTNSVASTPTPIGSSTPSSVGSITSVGVINSDQSPNSSLTSTTTAAAAKRFSFQARTIPQEPSGMRSSRSSSMDQRPNSARPSLNSVGRRSTLSTSAENGREKRVSYDETRMKKNLDLPENESGYRTSSLPRGTKIGNTSTDGSLSEDTSSVRKTDGNGNVIE